MVLPLLEGSLLEIMLATAEGRLHQVPVKFREGAACCVVLASQGYPKAYEKGFPITLPELKAGEEIYIAGAEEKDGRLLTSGGRVLDAVAVGDNLRQAVDAAYGLAERIQFHNAFYRRDIGRRALEALRGER